MFQNYIYVKFKHYHQVINSFADVLDGFGDHMLAATGFGVFLMYVANILQMFVNP